MAKVLLAFGDVGMAVPLQEELEAAGHQVRWDVAQTNGPAEGTVWADAVLLTSEEGTAALAAAVSAYRDAAPPPAVVLIGTQASDSATATELRIAHEPSTSSATALTAVIERAIKVRYASGLQASSPLHVALRALDIPIQGEPLDMAIRLLSAAREADVEMVREALRWHANHYATVDLQWVSNLREHRALQIPEVEFMPLLDGTRSLQTVLRSGALEPWRAARLLWTLASIGALRFTPEPPDQSTSRRRRLTQARIHLAARAKRLAQATIYDVLEVTPTADDAQVDIAARMLSLRYGPERISRMDLSELTHLAEPNWKQVLKARKVLRTPSERGRYNTWLTQQRGIKTEWANAAINTGQATQMMARGQKALLAGDLFKAVSDMATACRMHPHHPDYEASLAWARYRAEASRDREDREVLAKRELAIAEKSLLGHRPWPRALLALGLLSMTAGDADAARWHLHEALACDPNLPAAKQLLQRIGQR